VGIVRMATLAQKFPHYFLQRRGCCGGCTYDSVSCSLASSSTEATTSKSEEKSEVQLGEGIFMESHS